MDNFLGVSSLERNTSFLVLREVSQVDNSARTIDFNIAVLTINLRAARKRVVNDELENETDVSVLVSLVIGKPNDDRIISVDTFSAEVPTVLVLR